MRIPFRYPSRLKASICSAERTAGFAVLDGWNRRSRSRWVNSSALGMKLGVADVLMVWPGLRSHSIAAIGYFRHTHGRRRVPEWLLARHSHECFRLLFAIRLR